MSKVLIGDIEDVLESARKLGRLVRPEESADGDDDPKLPVKLQHQWSAYRLEPEVLVFVDPPVALAKLIVPTPDRHIAFTKDPVKAWKKWMENAEVVDHQTDRDKLVALLSRGSEKLGIPQFTRAAAAHLVASNPGGRKAIQRAVSACQAMELPEPISLEAVVGIWPFIPKLGKVYAVNLGDLIRALGTKKAVEMVKAIPDGESYSALKGLEIGCKKYPDRVSVIRRLLEGVMDKRWTPRVALVMFTHLCLSERIKPRWESRSTVTTLSSPPITRVYPLFDMSWLAD